jgi:uncharacterized protein Yka (UPF0111/DUF47 family)
MKSRIVEQLGQTDVLLPSLIAEGLSANDRVKVRLSALQAAAEHARAPDDNPIELEDECRAARLDPAAIRSLVTNAHSAANGRIAAPGLADLNAAIVEDVKSMIRAVAVRAPDQAQAARERLSAIKAEGLFAAGDDIELARIAKLTGVFAADSLHRLVMDLHKMLNRLLAECAEEVLAGAHVYALQAEDRPIVEAFMRGVDSTRALKFDHPGLDTTATRSGARLVIQNDIGTSDAHVVVITVESGSVTITYSDVHLERARFFTELFNQLPVRWSGLERQKADGLGEDGVFYLVTGRCEIPGEHGHEAVLETIGAALVFLIDWNKARKVLRSWVPNGDAVKILEWAARNRVGHRAFLQLGGRELVASAIRHAAAARIGFGEQLDVAFGRPAAVEFLKTVLRISTEALREGRSVRLVRDRIEADVARHLERVDGALLAVVVRQAGLARELAADLARHLANRRSGSPADASALAARARRIEEKADRIASEIRNDMARLNASPTIEQMVNQIEQAIDELEQAAFIASLLPSDIDPAVLAAPAELCSAALAGTETAASGVAAAAELPNGQQVDSDDAFAAVARLIDLEHEADAWERAVTALVLRGGLDVTGSLALLELARAAERATDRLAGFGHLLSRYVLRDLAA